MKITKLEHSGMVLEKNGRSLVFDPVEIDAHLPELHDVELIVITHKHGDHLQPQAIERILQQNPGARVLTTQDAASEIPGAEAHKGGENIATENFSLKFFGQNHASIVPGVVPCENLGVVVDDVVMNPGDSFDVPAGMEQGPEVLLVPSASPWNKVSESMEYIKTVRPKIAIPVHNAVLSEFGNGIQNNWLRQACEAVGVQFIPLGINESFEL